MRIKYLIKDTDMRCTQNGLKILIENKRGLVLKKNDFCLFLNRKQTQIKLLSWDFKMCISYKAGYGRLNPEIFTSLHHYWDGRNFDFKKAEYDALIKSLKKKNKTLRNKQSHS